MTTEKEAGCWFAARRRGVMSMEERANYEAWLSRRQNREAMAELEILWSLLDGTPKPTALPRRARKTLVSAVLLSSLVIAALSVTGNNHFWTALDWTNR